MFLLKRVVRVSSFRSDDSFFFKLERKIMTQEEIEDRLEDMIRSFRFARNSAIVSKLKEANAAFQVCEEEIEELLIDIRKE